MFTDTHNYLNFLNGYFKKQEKVNCKHFMIEKNKFCLIINQFLIKFMNMKENDKKLIITLKCEIFFFSHLKAFSAALWPKILVTKKLPRDAIFHQIKKTEKFKILIFEKKWKNENESDTIARQTFGVQFSWSLMCTCFLVK